MLPRKATVSDCSTNLVPDAWVRSPLSGGLCRFTLYLLLLILISLLLDRFSEGKGPKKKPRGRVWPGLISVGGDIQPQQVTVLTPATQRH